MSGLDGGDRLALERTYSGYDPPCLLDSSDGRSDDTSLNSPLQFNSVKQMESSHLININGAVPKEIGSFKF